MKVKSRSALEAEASQIFADTFLANYRPCEIVYLLSELMRLQSLVMLQKEKEMV